MTDFDRRHVLALGLGAAGAIAAPSKLSAQDRGLPSPYAVTSSYYSPRGVPSRINPVAFWSDTSLQLVALDHSVDAKDARAPGPCATARALALAHIVMADAVAAVFPVNFEGFYVRGARFPESEYPEVFVGAATARILEHIYSTPAHTHFIGQQRMQFLKHYDQGALTAWNAGLAFGRNELFTSRWNWEAIKYAALSSESRAQAPQRGEHDVDPFNFDQKFYGVTWGRVDPLLAGLPVTSLGPDDPPREYDREYVRDIEEVRELGAFRSQGPTPDQVKVGLFWAYDGARLIGTPPRFYCQIVKQIAEGDAMSVPDMARLLALCNLAMADAGIVCWEAKYRYKLWRPVLGIPNARFNPDRFWRPYGSPRTNPAQFSLGSDTRFRLTAQSMLGGGDPYSQSEGAQEFLAYHRAAFTPNFPSYPSGHAMFGSACFNVLKKVRAEYEPTRRDPGRLEVANVFVSDELNGVSIDHLKNEPRPYLPIKYTRIEQMIEDNNKSRIHLGVHWNFDCELGAAAGARLADAIYRNAYRRYR